MSWDTILGHDRIRVQFATAMEQDRLASTFLFLGPEGIGKRTFALKLAQTLLCPKAVAFVPCGTCPSCRQLLAGEHPDFEYVNRLPDRNQIMLEQILGDKSDRPGLCHKIAMKSYYGGRKVAILDDADDLRQESANALLKTLEEPPAGSVIILIGTAEQRQLPTIRSRCQIIRFGVLSWQQVQQILEQKELVSPPDMTERLARSSGGSVQAALSLFGEEVLEFRLQWFQQLAGIVVTANDYVKTLQAFVDSAGKEATPRRRRLIAVALWAAEFYRLTATALATGGTSQALVQHSDQELVALARTCSERWPSGLEGLAVALDRCLMIESQVMSNAHLVTLVESWLLDLNQAALGQVPFYPSLATTGPLT